MTEQKEIKKIIGRAVSVWLNEAEEKQLKDKAQSLGMKSSALLKKAAFDYAPTITKQTDPKLLAALARIGNNLNQLARKANRGGEYDPIQLEHIRRELEGLK